MYERIKDTIQIHSSLYFCASWKPWKTHAMLQVAISTHLKLSGAYYHILSSTALHPFSIFTHHTSPSTSSSPSALDIDPLDDTSAVLPNEQAQLNENRGTEGADEAMDESLVTSRLVDGVSKT